MNQFQLIMLALSGLESAIKLTTGLMAAAKQKAELTPSEEADLLMRQTHIMAQAHWRVEPDPDL